MEDSFKEGKLIILPTSEEYGTPNHMKQLTLNPMMLNPNVINQQQKQIHPELSLSRRVLISKASAKQLILRNATDQQHVKIQDSNAFNKFNHASAVETN